MFRHLRYLLELIRFSHTLFALPFALLAAVMAWSENRRGSPAVPWRWTELAGILLCMVTARSAAMAFNRLADAQIDAENPRTRERHLPAGTLSRVSVALFAAVCSAGFVAATLLFLPNRLPLYLSLPVLAFLMAYSFTKRFTALSHFWLGAALMVAPVSAWIAIRGEFVTRSPLDLLPAVVLGGAVLLWVAGFDMIYACQDFEFDRHRGLKSMPARLGIGRALRLAAVSHVGTIALLSLLPLVYNRFGWVYWTGLVAVAALLVYEHRLVRPDDLTRVNRAFFNVNAVVSLGLLIVGTIDLAISR
ncbi:MAG TPA: UbiA-like polyprenyltransferase [Pirellulales bacterium]|jgi:4-hydroxybenzoate polyprenyltransferase|nr:UbiA-like polyprenyltransferase [Pirellulales bacterium]